MNDGDKLVRSPEGLRLLEGVRGICSDLEGVVEAVDGFGHTSFRVKEKPFVIMGESDGISTLALKVGAETQEVLVARGDFIETPYIGRHGWATIPADQVEEWDEIADLVRQAFRGVAPASRD